jgi:Secretion system C-terminal sorting domain
MKKNYTLFIFILSLFAQNLLGQVIYPITTFAGYSENALDAQKVVFDDVGFSAAQVGPNNTLALTKIRTVLYRDPSAPATTVTVWVGVLNNLGKLEAIVLGTANLGVQGAAPQLIALTLGDGVALLDNIPLNSDASGNAFFYIGLQFSDPSDKNGWAFYTTPAAPNSNDDELVEYNVATKSSTFYNYTANPYASLGVEVSGSFKTLPVEMTSFTGKKTGLDQCTLNWATASEKSNEGYDVEKSSDGERFSKIEFVKGAGNSLIEQKYEYRDNTFSQSAYYRLKQNDSDGKYTYSKVIFIENKNGAKGKTSVYPNPNKGAFTIEHPSETEDISITNAIGQVVYSNKVKDVNRSDVDISNLPSGLYQVRLSGKNNYREVYPIQLSGQ